MFDAGVCGHRRSDWDGWHLGVDKPDRGACSALAASHI
jgi:hypothetical protein